MYRTVSIRTTKVDIVAIQLGGTTYFRIGEALDRAGVSRSTYFRWVRAGRIQEARYRDRNGRRVLTRSEVDSLCEVSNRVVVVESDPRQTRLELD